jgi:hypothetical protein
MVQELALEMFINCLFSSHCYLNRKHKILMVRSVYTISDMLLGPDETQKQPTNNELFLKKNYKWVQNI